MMRCMIQLTRCQSFLIERRMMTILNIDKNFVKYAHLKMEEANSSNQWLVTLAHDIHTYSLSSFLFS